MCEIRFAELNQDLKSMRGGDNSKLLSSHVSLSQYSASTGSERASFSSGFRGDSDSHW